jgi:Protein of unknown function (DUF3703)
MRERWHWSTERLRCDCLAVSRFEFDAAAAGAGLNNWASAFIVRLLHTHRSIAFTVRSALQTVAASNSTVGRDSLSFEGVTDESSLRRRHVAFACSEDHIVIDAYNNEVSLALLALLCRDYNVCFVHLERAHVLAQRVTYRHAYVHWLMLVAGLRRRDYREVVGQLPRILASVLFSRLWVPRGNTGRARLSAFKPMPVPLDLRHLFR